MHTPHRIQLTIGSSESCPLSLFATTHPITSTSPPTGRRICTYHRLPQTSNANPCSTQRRRSPSVRHILISSPFPPPSTDIPSSQSSTTALLKQEHVKTRRLAQTHHSCFKLLESIFTPAPLTITEFPFPAPNPCP